MKYEDHVIEIMESTMSRNEKEKRLAQLNKDYGLEWSEFEYPYWSDWVKYKINQYAKD